MSSSSAQKRASEIWHTVSSSVFRRFIILLLIAAYFSPHIWQHGEAREALVIQDILHNDHWIMPLRNDQLPSKPVLYHWIAAAAAKLIGASDFTMRLPSIIGAVLMIWFTYRLGVLEDKATIGLLAAGILGTLFEFWDSATEARVDMLFAALVGLSLTGWYVWYRSGAEYARAMAYIGVAFAVLTKGPAGAVLPVIVIVTFVIIQREFAKLAAFLSLPWIVIVLLVDLSWYIAAYQIQGADFWNKQIIHENVERYIGEGEFETKRGNLSQAVWFVTQLFPWSVVLLFSLIRWFRRGRRDPIVTYLHLWWSSILLFFLFASGQRAVYLLPIYPAVALLASRELQTWIAGRRFRAIAPGFFDPALTVGVIIAALNVPVALAVPISRTIQEDSSAQEEFVDGVIAEVPRTSRLYAAPEFPETTLMVLGYRLDRSIARDRPQCDGGYYLLTSGSAAAPSPPQNASAPVVDRKKGLYLLHIMPDVDTCGDID
jgi:4-amino-4-deoxy-L-arabinose transferase-like glycosyltransferase